MSTRPQLATRRPMGSLLPRLRTSFLHSMVSIRFEKAKSWREPENRLGPTGFWCLWAWMACLRLAFAVHLGLLAYAHAFVSSGRHEYERRTMRLQDDLRVPVVMCCAVGMLHVYGLVNMAWNRRQTTRLERVRAIRDMSKRGGFEPSHPLVRRLWHLYTKHMIGKGQFGIQGEYFSLRSSVSHGLSIALHTYQAFKVTFLSTSTRLNLLMAGCLAANCIVAPLLFTIRMRPVLQRTAAIWTTVGFTAFFECGLPWLSVAPYLAYFTWDDEVQTSHLYDDVWFYDAALLGRRFFLNDLSDVCSRLLPCVLAYLSLANLEGIVSVAHDYHHPTINYAVHNHPQLYPRRTPPPPSRGKHMHSTKVKVALHVAVVWSRVVGLLWGVGVLFLAVTFSDVSKTLQVPCPHGCLSRVYPWFATDCRCVIQLVNCHARAIDQDQLPQVLDTLDPHNLQLLILAHCPDLVVPPLDRFESLFGLEIFNSTIVDWPTTAALTADAFQSLSYLLLVRTDLVEIPPAIYQRPLPPTLLDIEIVNAKVSYVSNDTFAAWAGLNTLFLESCHITSVPTSIDHLRVLNQMSLYDNDLSNADAIAHLPMLWELSVSKNPRLDSLPHDLTSLPALTTVLADLTNISSLTDTWRTQVPALSLAATPFCSTTPDAAQFCDHPAQTQGMFPSHRLYREFT
ncbi:hypothetical protein DYB34_002675 [Aphanomyces astaci]|uniref:Leucine-rich repeat-containing N-terminal plant-type domain-containing protein n=1 Tax=Aphanomyces astaci TaxID=112090 RepID=A0A3R6ZFD2_APHAT|nr:hypothetical protein DYB34_002675 [Aphanomyces astaci]